MPPIAADSDLPDGVIVRPLEMNPDSRGSLTEIFRSNWDPDLPPLVQWEFVRSGAGVLRGMKVHPRHSDYLVVVRGRASIILHDFRPWSSTRGRHASIEVSGDHLQSIVIPPGIGHAFWFPEPSDFVLGTSHYYDPDDELTCDRSDPALCLATLLPEAIASQTGRTYSTSEIEEILSSARQ
jgi:dTDP-4-dehydrorhamnose 3,5-epimerase